MTIDVSHRQVCHRIAAQLCWGGSSAVWSGHAESAHPKLNHLHIFPASITNMVIAISLIHAASSQKRDNFSKTNPKQLHVVYFLWYLEYLKGKYIRKRIF